MRDYMDTRQSLLGRVGTNPDAGLTDAQARRSAKEHGVNALTPAKGEPLFARIWHSATEPMILMLLAAGATALVVNVVRAATGGEAEFLECVGIFAAISLSVLITVVMEGRSAKAFEALSRLGENVMVKAVRNGSPVMLNQKQIVRGDVLLLQTGDRVPADGRLISAMELSCDESALTGESQPAHKDAELVICDAETPVAERGNMLYAGSYVASGYAKLLVTAVGDGTELGQIARELSGEDRSATPLQQKLRRLGRTITIFGVIAAAIVFITQLISFATHEGLVLEEVMEAFVTSIVLIVAAVPEGLPTIVAVSLSISVIKLSKQNALVKKMIACETVGCVNVICSDKTGTLTQNRMTVIGAVQDARVLANICLNSTADLGANDAFIGNPTECALLTAAKKAGWRYRELRGRANIAHVFPFSSEEKDMTTVVREPDGFVAYTKGSPEKVLRSCGLSGERRAAVEAQIEEYQKKACRVIAFAHRVFPACPAFEEEAIESGMAYDGFCAISDPLRVDVLEAVRHCREAGVELKMLTGDNIVTAAAIANELQLLDGSRAAVDARDLAHLSDAELSKRLSLICVIARSTPGVKMRVVKLLRAMGNVVAVTGDGINDAPALKNADVGIAMGISGTEVSKEASDIVLLNDSFSTIVHAIEWGRGIFENFRRFITFQLTVNVASVAVVLGSILLGLKAPFTALQLLWINIIMDGPPALTLGLEPTHDGLMRAAPVGRNEHILSKPMLIRIGVTGGYMSFVFLLQNTVNFLGATSAQMPTVLFALFSLLQLFNAFNCRELNGRSIFANLLSNRLMLCVISVTFVLQIVIIQFAGAFFGTVALPFFMWLRLFALSASVVALSELVKWLVRRAGGR